MAYYSNSSDINQTFIIEPLSLTGGAPTVSACTAVFTNNVVSCDYNTIIFLGDGVINFDGNLYTNDNLTANTINASTYYSGGTNLFDIIDQRTITGGTFNNNTDTLTLTKVDNTNIVVTGFTDYYTTGATLIGNTIYFDRNDTLSAYTVNLSTFTADTYVTGVSFTNNQIIITRNDGVNLSTFINTMTGLTINGLLSSSNISATTISTISLNSNSITALTLTSNTINSNNINAQTISATTYYGDGSNLSGVKYTGGTVTGNTLFQGVITASTLIVTGSTILNTLTANTISATTYQNLPVSGLTAGSNIGISDSNGNYTITLTGITGFEFTGGTVTGATIFTNGLTANTISATTISATNYNNLPLDVKVTGFTYSSNTFTIYDNSGQTFPATFNVVSGLTVNGGLTATTIYGNGSNITNIQIVNVDNLQSELANKFDKSGGTVTGSVLITGDVTVMGTATTINTQTLTIKDNIITLNSNATGNTVPYPINSGIEILRNSATTANLLWNEASGYWMAGLSGSSKQIILSGDSLSLLNSGHTHPISEIVDLQLNLNNKLDTSGGTINGGLNVTNGLTATTYYGNGSNLTGISKGGGGGGQLYYFNISNTQGPYYEFSTSATSVGQQSITVSTGASQTAYIGGFMTPSNLPNVSELPAGITSFYVNAYTNNSSATFNLYCEFYKRTTGGAETLLLTSDPIIVVGTSPTMYVTDTFFSGTSLNNTDRLVVKVYATNTSVLTRSITMLSEGNASYSFSYTTIPTSSDTYVTGFTYSNNTLTIKQNNDQSDYSQTINQFTGLTINGDFNVIGNATLSALTSNTISATTYQNLPISALTGGSNISITGANGSYAISFTGTTGSNFTGGTVTGATNFTSGLTANTISATTYQNLPISGLTAGSNISITGSNGNYTVSFTGTTGSNFTGGTVTGATIYTGGLSANTLNVSGVTILDGTTASTISATTINAVNYLNLPYPNYITTGSSGTYSLKTANGSANNATADYAISFGYNTIASGQYSHAEGNTTIASGITSHAEGYQTYAYGDYSHVEGYQTYAYGAYSHAEGFNSIAIGTGSTAKGYYSVAGFQYIWPEYTAFTSSNKLIIRGYDYRNQFIINTDGLVVDFNNVIYKLKITGATTYTQLSTGVSGTTISFSGGNLSGLGSSIVRIISTTSGGTGSHAESNGNAVGDYSHAEGIGVAIGSYSHAEGLGVAIGSYSHAEGNGSTASNEFSHAEGVGAIASGVISHSEGQNTIASGAISHAEGDSTTASGFGSHSEGGYTTAAGAYSYASGYYSVASGNTSFVHGSGSTALGFGTMVFGSNITGTLSNTAYFERGRFIGTGTTSPILQVSGSVGSLLQVNDEITADIFNVVDVNSHAIFQVFSGDVVTMGNYVYPSYNTTSGMTITASSLMNIVSVPTTYNNNGISYDSVFVDYSVKYSGGARAGNIMIIQSGSTVQFSETSTNDIGDASVFTFSANTANNYINLYLSSTTNTGTIKTIVRAI